jgi:hypothetical protein
VDTPSGRSWSKPELSIDTPHLKAILETPSQVDRTVSVAARREWTTAALQLASILLELAIRLA